MCHSIGKDPSRQGSGTPTAHSPSSHFSTVAPNAHRDGCMQASQIWPWGWSPSATGMGLQHAPAAFSSVPAPLEDVPGAGQQCHQSSPQPGCWVSPSQLLKHTPDGPACPGVGASPVPAAAALIFTCLLVTTRSPAAETPRVQLPPRLAAQRLIFFLLQNRLFLGC